MGGFIPPSIDHGDLHSNNIHVRDEGMVFFDWGDATVTHPFFSTAVFWNALEELVDSESEWPKMVQQFKPYYLTAWSKYAAREELARMSEISDQLACVYRALSWYLYINPTRKDISDTYQRPAQWLQILLEKRG
jgi:aminoglycoside phosphotransferase (APT) family kinase protein